MHVDEIRSHIRRQPFEPFRLYVSDGSRYDVLHHDFVLVMKRSVAVAIGAPSVDDYPDKMVDIDPVHITQIEPLKSASNGGSGRRTRKRKPQQPSRMQAGLLGDRSVDTLSSRP